jgi:hypothetical protein
MDIVICPNCQAKLNPKEIKGHFTKVHPEVALPAANHTNYTGSAMESAILKSGLDRVYNYYLAFELRFRSLKRADYFEAIEIEYNRLSDEVDNYLDITAKEMQMDGDTLQQIMSYKCRIIEEMEEKLNQLIVELPTYDQYLKAQYQTIYVTWSDLTFDKDKIRISANKAFVKAIEIPERRINWKNLKIDHFRKHYPNARFKLVVYKGVIMEDRSKGIAQILECVEMVSPAIRGRR